MPLPEHPVRLPQGIAIVDGKPLMTAAALLYVVKEQLTDEEVYELTSFASEDLSQYCQRATQWLLEHGKVSL